MSNFKRRKICEFTEETKFMILEIRLTIILVCVLLEMLLPNDYIYSILTPFLYPLAYKRNP